MRWSQFNFHLLSRRISISVLCWAELASRVFVPIVDVSSRRLWRCCVRDSRRLEMSSSRCPPPPPPPRSLRDAQAEAKKNPGGPGMGSLDIQDADLLNVGRHLIPEVDTLGLEPARDMGAVSLWAGVQGSCRRCQRHLIELLDSIWGKGVHFGLRKQFYDRR